MFKRMTDPIKAVLMGVLVACCLASTACSDLHAEDAKHLAALNERFGTRFEFHLIDNQSVLAVPKGDEPATREEAVEIYRAFWFSGEGLRPTPFLSLLVYDKGRRLIFSLHFDETKKQFIFTEGGSSEGKGSIPPTTR